MPATPPVSRAPSRKPTPSTTVTTMSVRNQADSSGPTINELRGAGAIRNRSKKPVSRSPIVANPSPTPPNAEPMHAPSGMNQLIERSVGKPGTLGDREERAAEGDALEDRHDQGREERRRQAPDAAQVAHHQPARRAGSDDSIVGAGLAVVATALIGPATSIAAATARAGSTRGRWRPVSATPARRPRR